MRAQQAIFTMFADRLPDDDGLASQPNLSRFENAAMPADLLRLEDWFIQRFVDSFDEPPIVINLDIDVFDDPTDGQQQLVTVHGNPAERRNEPQNIEQGTAEVRRKEEDTREMESPRFLWPVRLWFSFHVRYWAA